MTFTAKHKHRLMLIALAMGCLILATAVLLVALKQNINLFFTPSQLMETQISPHQTIRLGGMVEQGSIVREQDLRIKFAVTDFKAQIVVNYRGILPDLFKEGQGVVIVGSLAENGVFNAKQVLAKHDETYMPPQVARNIIKEKDN